MRFPSFPASSLLLLTTTTLGACSSSSPSGVSPSDAGGPDASPLDAGVDAALPDIPEPTYAAAVEPGCTVNGCIRELTAKTSYKKALLQGSADPSFTVKNGVVEYFIRYWSDGQEITGSLFFPDSAPPAAGFGVVVMNQFTSGLGTSCAPSTGTLALGVAGATALNGFVTLAPDATSYGKAPYGAYIWEKIAGRAALDGVRAVLHTNLQAIAQKAVIAGLSQGAYSTMSAATELPGYAPRIAVSGFVAAEPPANVIQGIQNSVVADKYTIVYDAMRLYSWQGLLGLSGGPIFRSCPGSADAGGGADASADGGSDAGPGCIDYSVQAPIWFANECVFNGDGSSGTLYGEFPTNASTVLTDAFLGYAKDKSWPADWAAAYAASGTVPKGLTRPVLIFEGSADTTVLPADVDAYVAQLRAAGVTVDYRSIPNGTHLTTALSSFTVAQLANDQALAWITATLGN